MGMMEIIETPLGLTAATVAFQTCRLVVLNFNHDEWAFGTRIRTGIIPVCLFSDNSEAFDREMNE
jgi:hypothetical protein